MAPLGEKVNSRSYRNKQSIHTPCDDVRRFFISGAHTTVRPQQIIEILYVCELMRTGMGKPCGQLIHKVTDKTSANSDQRWVARGRAKRAGTMDTYIKVIFIHEECKRALNGSPRAHLKVLLEIV
jgi:hypothetical protein